MTAFGTSHFVNRTTAILYYREYQYDNIQSAVDRKIAEGEIHLGKPVVQSGNGLC